jgi:hypothetical protein
MSEVRARQSAPAAQAQAPVNPVMEPEKMPQANDPLTVAFGPEGERMRAGIDQFIDEPSAPMSKTERLALLLTGGAPTKVRGALQLVGRAGNIFEAGGEQAGEPEIRAKTMRDTLLQPFRRLRAHTEEPWQIEIDRARAIHQTVDGAMKKFGAPGAFAAQFGIMGYELAVNIAMLKTITAASPWASSGSVDTASKGFMKAWAATGGERSSRSCKDVHVDIHNHSRHSRRADARGKGHGHVSRNSDGFDGNADKLLGYGNGYCTESDRQPECQPDL